MSRAGAKVNKLKGLIREGIIISERAVVLEKENEILKKRVKDLQVSCEVFSEPEENPHKKISELEKERHKFLEFKQRVKGFFS